MKLNIVNRQWNLLYRLFKYPNRWHGKNTDCTTLKIDSTKNITSCTALKRSRINKKEG